MTTPSISDLSALREVAEKETPKHWVAVQQHDGWAIFYDPTPGGKKNKDGSTTFSLRFPALKLTDFVQDPEKVAHDIAESLNSDRPETLAAEKARADAAEADFHESQSVRLETGKLLTKTRERAERSEATISTLTAERDALKRERDELAEVGKNTAHTLAEDLKAAERERDEARAANPWKTGPMPTDGTVIYRRTFNPYRYLAYKPNSQQAKRGEKGRWQAMNEYGGWDTCSHPLGNEWCTEAEFTPAPSSPVQENRQMSEILLPCPFCGGEGDDSLELCANLVQCLECGARGPAQDGPEFVCDARLARTEWNRRAERTRALSQLEAGKTLKRVQHRKRGTEYEILGVGKMQAETWEDMTYQHQVTSVDMREVTIYRSVDDGALWVRPQEEFEDGRFIALASPSPAPEAEPGGKRPNLNITQEWFEKQAALEADYDPTTGRPDYIPGFVPSAADKYYNAVIARLRAKISELSTPTPAVDADAVIETAIDAALFRIGPYLNGTYSDATRRSIVTTTVKDVVRALSLPPSADKGE